MTTYRDMLIEGLTSGVGPTWQDLADAGLVAADSIGGGTDAEWLIGHDVIADAECYVCEHYAIERIDADDDGLVYVRADGGQGAYDEPEGL